MLRHPACTQVLIVRARKAQASLLAMQGLTRTTQELRVFLGKSNEALSTSVSSEDVDHLIEVTAGYPRNHAIMQSCNHGSVTKH
jgi:hypothetical protein